MARRVRGALSLTSCRSSTAPFAWAKAGSSSSTPSASTRINAWEPELELLDDAELRAQADALRERAREGESLDDLLPETFAVVRETSRRTMGMRHFDVQLIGGMVLHDGAIAEMRTGEGKTLTGTLSVVLNALAGEGVHVVTVNDYLARRDAEWMSPIYTALGLTIGVLQNNAALRGEARRLRGRHHVRHQLGVRLRLPARQHGDVAGGEGPARRAARRGRASRSACTTTRSSTRWTTSSSTRRARR